MTWIQTRTGRQVEPFTMTIDDLDLEDIGWSLSMLCRFTGHCRRFLSVAEHSLNVASLAPPKHRLCALLHDGAEAYLGDIARPVKRNGVWRVPLQQAERRIQVLIAEKWGCCADFACCADADEIMLATEGVALMGLTAETCRQQWPSLRHDPLPAGRAPPIGVLVPAVAFATWRHAVEQHKRDAAVAWAERVAARLRNLQNHIRSGSPDIGPEPSQRLLDLIDDALADS